MSMEFKPSYVTNTVKALEAILWIAEKEPSFDVYHVVKAAYFADKHHIATYGRPVCGDAYSAAPYGPLPQVMYGLLKGEPLELIALDSNGELPFSIASKFTIRPSRGPNLRKLSGTDVEALTIGIEHVRGRSFDAIFHETHEDPAYLRAEGARMDYRDFVPDDDPHKHEKTEIIEETAPYAVF
jgi:hypothetical protein